MDKCGCNQSHCQPCYEQQQALVTNSLDLPKLARQSTKKSDYVEIREIMIECFDDYESSCHEALYEDVNETHQDFLMRQKRLKQMLKLAKLTVNKKLDSIIEKL